MLSMYAEEAEIRNKRSNDTIQHKSRDPVPKWLQKKLQTGWELCFTEMTEHKTILQKRKSSLFTCQFTCMKSIQVLLSGRALHYLELLIINNLNITSWEETAIALRTQPLPPSRVNLINVQYDLAGIEENLSRVRSLVVIKSYSTCAVKLSGLLDSPSPVTTVGWCTPPFPQYWGGNKASLPPLSSDECDYQMQEEGEQYHWAPLPYHPQCSPCFPQ